MSTATTLEGRDLTVPDTIDSPRAKLVYLYLETATEATVADIQTALDMKRISLYSVLDTLVDRELVEQQDGRYAVA